MSDDDIRQETAKAIRGMRKRSGLSQAGVAKRLGTTQATVSRWESASTTPDANDLVKYAAACSADALMPGLSNAINHARLMLSGEEE